MRLHTKALVLLAVGAAAAAVAINASASWLVAVSAGPATIASATVEPPTGVSAARDCVRGARNNVILTWSPSTSSLADGYVIYRQLNAKTPKLIATIAGGGTATYTDVGPGASKTFTYTVQTTIGTWLSVPSNAAVITTPNNRCK